MDSVVVTWGPAQAAMLQRALRLTNEAFAEQLGAATRTIAKWRANPDIQLTLEMQQALDTMLSRAQVDAQRRFEQTSVRQASNGASRSPDLMRLATSQ